MASPHDLSELARLDRSKRRDVAVGDSLGDAMAALYHQTVAKKQTKFADIADAWCRIVPAKLVERTALETYHRGKLTVLVDSAPHLYELKQLLLAGLELQLLAACKGAGLTKINLKRGRWSDDL